jgi:hypothetical protein
MKGDLHKHYNLLPALDKPISAESIKNSYLDKGVKERSLKYNA